VSDIGPDADRRRREPVSSIFRSIPSRMSRLLPKTEQQKDRNRTIGAERDYARRIDYLKAKSTEEDELTLRTLLRILVTLTSTLKTLSVFFESRSLSLPFWESDWQPTFPSLPALTELTITYRALNNAEWSQWRILDRPESLPSLKRLNMSGVYVQFYTPFHCYQCISTRAPSLTHLCIPEQMVDSFQAALAENRPALEEDPRGILPSSLEHVFIQLSRRPQATCSDGEERYADDCVSCHSLSAKDERFAVLRMNRDSIKSHSTAKQEWLDRIDGGEGNWDVGNRIVRRSWGRY